MTVVGVRFNKNENIQYVDPGELAFKINQMVIVSRNGGLESGRIKVVGKMVDKEELAFPLAKVVRIATSEDHAIYEENKTLAKEAFNICVELIQKHKLVMNLIDTKCLFDRKKMMFYFTAEKRVDFRMLVRDLASFFRMRIELRQVGVRDEAKLIGGVGPCGRQMCCSSFLDNFEPIAIKVAKNQSLSLNPKKISGICGRLMCCLKYENDDALVKKIPPVGEVITTPDGSGKVVDVKIFEGDVWLLVEINSKIQEYNFEHLGSLIASKI